MATPEVATARAYRRPVVVRAAATIPARPARNSTAARATVRGAAIRSRVDVLEL
jgi:hypothetical protein